MRLDLQPASPVVLATRQGFDPDTHVGALPSPCINVCKMHETSGLCTGCRRSLSEIVAWSHASETEKRAVWRAIQARNA